MAGPNKTSKINSHLCLRCGVIDTERPVMTERSMYIKNVDINFLILIPLLSLKVKAFIMSNSI